jgi:hypothetical protein
VVFASSTTAVVAAATTGLYLFNTNTSLAHAAALNDAAAQEQKDSVVVATPAEEDVVEEEEDLLKNAFDAITYPFLYVYGTVFGVDDSLLVPPLVPDNYSGIPRTVVLNFDKTLVYSQWSRDLGWVVRKRPHLDNFLKRLWHDGYEIIVWSNAPQGDAEQHAVDADRQMAVRHRLFREHMDFKDGRLVKDLMRLGRDPNKMICIEFDETEAIPGENVLKVKPFVDDINDKELLKVMAFLHDVQKYNVQNVRRSIAKYNAQENTDYFADEVTLLNNSRNLLRGIDPKAKTAAGSNGGGWFSGITRLCGGK